MQSPEEIAAVALVRMDTHQTKSTNSASNSQAQAQAQGPAKEPAKEPAKAQALVEVTGTKRLPTDESLNAAPTPKKKRRGPKPKIKYPVHPTAIQTIPKRKEVINHSYSDFSNIPISLDYKMPSDINAMSFSEKLHHILQQTSGDCDYSRWIVWRPHGRAVSVLVPKLFEEKVCPIYFGHKRYSSFLRELNNYGFKLLTKGDDRNCYYHECFLRGKMHLCQYMPPKKDARRLIPDPTNEPNLKTISDLYPLDTSATAGAASPQEHKLAASEKTIAVALQAAISPCDPPCIAVSDAAVPLRPSIPPQQQQSVFLSVAQKEPKGIKYDRAAAVHEINHLRVKLATDILDEPPADRFPQPLPSRMPIGQQQSYSRYQLAQLYETRHQQNRFFQDTQTAMAIKELQRQRALQEFETVKAHLRSQQLQTLTDRLRASDHL